MQSLDFSVKAALEKIEISDCIQTWGKDFQNLVSSVNENAPSSKPLIEAMFMSETSESGRSKNSLSFFFNTLHVVCNRETIVLLAQISLQFIDTTLYDLLLLLIYF
jgi:hypothetical protein